MKIELNRINEDYLFEAKNSNGHSIILDNKSKKEGKVEGVSPMELLLMGVAGCSSIDIVHILGKQKINPKDLKVFVKGNRIDGQVPSLFTSIEVEVNLEGDIPKEKAIRAVQLSFDKYCSVSKTLEKSAPVVYSLVLNGEKCLSAKEV